MVSSGRFIIILDENTVRRFILAVIERSEVLFEFLCEWSIVILRIVHVMCMVLMMLQKKTNGKR